jgi:DnaK suppressor protein
MSVDADRFRTLLLEERERVEDALHPADTATATLDHELDVSLEESSTEVLAAIDAALQRIDDGTYGICTKCGREIAEERLEARPWSQLCIEDQRREERR